MTTGTSAESLAARFALETLRDGGVLVDLRTGVYFELNVTAADTVRALLDEPDRDRVIARISARYAIDEGRSRALVDTVLADLAANVTSPEELPGPFRFERRDDRFLLEDEGAPVLEIDPMARTVGVHARAGTLRYSRLEYVRSVTPKLLSLLGVTVLHASACVPRGRLTAFSGPSGAGKTTTCRAFVAADATPVSEDLLLLDSAALEPTCFVQGERRAHDWADQAAARLEPGGAPVSFEPLALAAAGPTARVHDVWMIDASRRHGHTFEAVGMNGVSATLSMLRNTFFVSADAPTWARHLSRVRALAEGVEVLCVDVPIGLGPLENSARGYVKNSTS